MGHPKGGGWDRTVGERGNSAEVGEFPVSRRGKLPRHLEHIGYGARRLKRTTAERGLHAQVLV
jgi:hypothetical protein